MRTFLLKTEPSEYAFADLVRDGVAPWTGVANPAALIALRSASKGDQALIYHTGKDKAVVGLGEFVSNPYPDPARAERTSDGLPKHAVLDVRALKPARTPVTLGAMKSDPRFAAFALVKQPRLSVMLVPPALDKAIRAMGGL